MDAREDLRTSPFSNDATKKRFQEAKRQIESIYGENQASVTKTSKPQPLTLAIAEFYKVQREFSQSMELLVLALKKHLPSNTEVYPVLIEEIIRPYQILAENPFNPHPTGNNQEDILHILRVITNRNEQFTSALRALSVSISKTAFTHEVLDEFKKNPELEVSIKKELNCDSWMIVKGHADKPFQNLTRIELLLKEIQKRLEGAGEEKADSILMDLADALSELSPQVQAINENIDSLILLNRAERILSRLSQSASVKYHSMAAIAVPDDYETAPAPTINQLIEFTTNCIHQGVRMILAGHQDEVVLYEQLLTLLKEIYSTHMLYLEENKTYVNMASEYVYSSYNSVYFTMFGENAVITKTPMDELKELLDEWGLLLERMKIVMRIPEINAKAVDDYNSTLSNNSKQ